VVNTIKIIFQVIWIDISRIGNTSSGRLGYPIQKPEALLAGDIRDLLGTITLENASISIFITLENPSKDMLKTAKSAGFYQNKLMPHSCDKI
jgi:hypothetical protein